jgi:Uma2 family endonuclease
MNMIPSKPTSATTQRGRDCFVMYNIGWQGYNKILEVVGNREYRITYSQGNLELMSPLPVHERYKHVFACFFAMMALEIESFHVVALASTTFRREDLDRGIEPDECYYITSPVEITGNEAFDLSRNPPPDLAVEVDITRSVLDRMDVYRNLGVPEIWRFDGTTLQVYRLNAARQYQLQERSQFFPFLPMDELALVVQHSADILDEGQLLRTLGTWVRTRALPLMQAQGNQPLTGDSING